MSIVKQIHSLFPYRRFENRSLEWLVVMLFYNRLLAMRHLQLTTLIPLIFVPNYSWKTSIRHLKL